MMARPGPGDGSRAVAIGGGHGLSRSLRALTRVVDHVTAVVTVADDGGSSGRLRRDLDVLPPGDLRMALAALAQDRGFAELLQYRFTRGDLTGHSLGNLILVALTDLSGGDPVRALDRVAQVLDAPGRVLPCTTEPVTLRARTPDGEVTGQAAVAATARLERVWLEPADVRATADALEAVRRADLVVIGPGSLFTSILPNLLVAGLGDAVATGPAPVVFIANLREQPGETEGLGLIDHLEILKAHVPRLRLDVVVAHDGPAPVSHHRALTADPQALARHAGQVVCADLLDGADGHDVDRLARVLDGLLRGDRSASP